MTLINIQRQEYHWTINRSEKHCTHLAKLILLWNNETNEYINTCRNINFNISVPSGNINIYREFLINYKSFRFRFAKLSSLADFTIFVFRYILVLNVFISSITVLCKCLGVLPDLMMLSSTAISIQSIRTLAVINNN